MKRFIILSVVTLLLAVGNSLAQDVRYNFDKNADVSKFKTYKWVPIKDAAKVSDLVDKQVKEAIDAELTTKGLSKVDGNDTNLMWTVSLRLVKRSSLIPTVRTGAMAPGMEGAGMVAWVHHNH